MIRMDRIEASRDSHEWRSVKGLMSRKLAHRQEVTYELEDTYCHLPPESLLGATDALDDFDFS